LYSPYCQQFSHFAVQPYINSCLLKCCLADMHVFDREPLTDRLGLVWITSLCNPQIVSLTLSAVFEIGMKDAHPEMLILTGFMQHVQKANKIKPVCCTCWLVEANLLNFLVMGRGIIHSLQLLLFSSALGIVLLCVLPHNQCVGRGLIPRASSFDLCVNSLGKMCG
jgi:hypothetical protein